MIRNGCAYDDVLTLEQITKEVNEHGLRQYINKLLSNMQEEVLLFCGETFTTIEKRITT